MTSDIQDFDVSRNARGRLLLRDKRSGQQHEGVIAVRAFPVAAPDEGIALMSADGHELAWIANLAELSEPLRSLLREELNSREFLPQILRIKSASGASAQSTWQVQTDRGDTELSLKGEESIRRTGGGALLVTDVHGVQYLVRSLSALDRNSRKVLDRYM